MIIMQWRVGKLCSDINYENIKTIYFFSLDYIWEEAAVIQAIFNNFEAAYTYKIQLTKNLAITFFPPLKTVLLGAEKSFELKNPLATQTCISCDKPPRIPQINF